MVQCVRLYDMTSPLKGNQQTGCGVPAVVKNSEERGEDKKTDQNLIRGFVESPPGGTERNPARTGLMFVQQPRKPFIRRGRGVKAKMC